MSTAAQIIAKHQLDIIDGTCTCGEWDYADVPDHAPDLDLTELHAAHVVAALANAGRAIVDRDLLGQASTSLDAGATIVDNHASMLAQLVMDTQKDQELTDRLVLLARNSAQNLRSAAARVAEGGERGE